MLNLDNAPPGASLLSMAAHRLSRLLRTQLGRVLAEHGELSLVDWRICVGLSKYGTITQKELVAFTKIEQGQVSRSLAMMEDRQLIESERATQDKRTRLFSLTENGRSRFNQILQRDILPK